MNPTTNKLLALHDEELVILTELLESARNKLAVEIRHTDHRAFRDDLRHRLMIVEELLERCHEE
jgi:hypothetical protein